MNNVHRLQNFRQISNLFSQIWLKKRHTSLFSGICRKIRTKFHKKFAEKMQNSTNKMKKSEIQCSIAKKCSRFLAEILRLKNGAKECISPHAFPCFWDSIPKWCKGVHCVDLGDSFATSIYLQNLASWQPRTSPVKFAGGREPSCSADHFSLTARGSRSSKSAVKQRGQHRPAIRRSGRCQQQTRE